MSLTSTASDPLLGVDSNIIASCHSIDVRVPGFHGNWQIQMLGNLFTFLGDHP